MPHSKTFYYMTETAKKWANPFTHKSLRRDCYQGNHFTTGHNTIYHLFRYILRITWVPFNKIKCYPAVLVSQKNIFSQQFVCVYVCVFPALPGLYVVCILCQSLWWSLYEELHHTDWEALWYPQLPHWGYRWQLRNGYVQIFFSNILDGNIHVCVMLDLCSRWWHILGNALFCFLAESKMSIKTRNSLHGCVYR